MGSTSEVHSSNMADILRSLNTVDYRLVNNSPHRRGRRSYRTEFSVTIGAVVVAIAILSMFVRKRPAALRSSQNTVSGATRTRLDNRVDLV